MSKKIPNQLWLIGFIMVFLLIFYMSLGPIMQEFFQGKISSDGLEVVVEGEKDVVKTGIYSFTITAIIFAILITIYKIKKLKKK